MEYLDHIRRFCPWIRTVVEKHWALIAFTFVFLRHKIQMLRIVEIPEKKLVTSYDFLMAWQNCFSFLQIMSKYYIGRSTVFFFFITERIRSDVDNASEFLSFPVKWNFNCNQREGQILWVLLSDQWRLQHPDSSYNFQHLAWSSRKDRQPETSELCSNLPFGKPNNGICWRDQPRRK